MKTTKIFSVVTAGVLAAGAVFAQEPDPGMACCAAMMPGMTGANKGQMMEWHKSMTEKMKAQDAEIDKLVQEMNAATGDQKVEAMAKVINKTMEHRKAWHSEMESRQKKMMDWMKEKGTDATKGLKSGTTPIAP